MRCWIYTQKPRNPNTYVLRSNFSLERWTLPQQIWSLPKLTFAFYLLFLSAFLTRTCLSTLAFYFWDFLQNCCVKQFCKNWDLLFLTPSWSFLQAKRCQWLVSKDKKLWAPLISCFFSCVNRLGQKFGILHQHPCKPFGVFGEVWDSSKKRPSIVNIFSSTRLQN